MAFHLHRNGQSIPHDLPTLREMARKGELAQDEYVYVDEKGEWIGAGQVPELNGAWSIGENEATVAMEIPADFGAMFDELEKKKVAAQEEQRNRAPEPAPLPVRQQAAPQIRAQTAPQQPAPQQPAPQQPAPRSLYEEPRSSGGGGGGGRSGRPQRPTGEMLDPMKTTLFSFLCFIYMIVWMFKRLPEINAFLGEERLVWWHMLIPILNIILLWKLFKSISEMARLAGAQVEDRSVIYLLCWVCVGPLAVYFLQTDLNTIWQAAGGRGNT